MSGYSLGIFAGDGRQVIAPTQYVIGACEVAIPKGAARKIISNFVQVGLFRSLGGGTLWVVLEFCKHNGIKYTLTTHDGGGWSLAVDRH